MFKLFPKKSASSTTKSSLTWDPMASQALEKALSQAPVPGALKGTVRKQLTKAAENQARLVGHDTVTAEDLMQGLLAKMPANLRSKIEQAAQKGPAGMKDLEDELRQK